MVFGMKIPPIFMLVGNPMCLNVYLQNGGNDYMWMFSEILHNSMVG